MICRFFRHLFHHQPRKRRELGIRSEELLDQIDQIHHFTP